MKRLTFLEMCALAIALVFIVAGADMILRPTERVVFHPGGGKGMGSYPSEQVSKPGSQVYGGIAVVLGAGLAVLALYRRGK